MMILQGFCVLSFQVDKEKEHDFMEFIELRTSDVYLRIYSLKKGGLGIMSLDSWNLRRKKKMLVTRKLERTFLKWLQCHNSHKN